MRTSAPSASRRVEEIVHGTADGAPSSSAEHGALVVSSEALIPGWQRPGAPESPHSANDAARTKIPRRRGERTVRMYARYAPAAASGADPRQGRGEPGPPPGRSPPRLEEARDRLGGAIARVPVPQLGAARRPRVRERPQRGPDDPLRVGADDLVRPLRHRD